MAEPNVVELDYITHIFPNNKCSESKEIIKFQGIHLLPNLRYRLLIF
jgi:hypothetical protein